MSHLHARPAFGALVLASLVAAIGGCVKDSDSIHCGGSFWCPKGMQCGADGRSCLPTTCGDGTVQENEQCDPGLERQTATCNSDCTRSRCGDGFVNSTAGEACDPGVDARETDACNFDCTVSRCGDGVVNFAAGEECDDRGESSICNIDCTLLRCGDGKRNQAGGEECDDGAANSDTGACLSSCRSASCGDGQVESGVEECDEGPSSASEKSACPYGQERCTLCSRCRWKQLDGPRCGDGIRQDPEVCDDGARNGASACPYGSHTCQICNTRCTAMVAATGPFCGDGKENGPEVCDDGALNGATACPYGTPSCSLCNATCAALVSRVGPWCGDGLIDGPDEECDSAVSTACGTCSASCRRRGTSSAAGSITVRSINVDAGVTFSVNDGTREEVFEFVIDPGEVTGGRLPIVVPSALAPTELLAQRIADAIDAKCGSNGGLGLEVRLTRSVVGLTNSRPGVNGNQPLGPVDVPAVTFEGMAGGVGCVTGELCASDQDCVVGSCLYQVCR